jgi:hypothetical protein
VSDNTGSLEIRFAQSARKHRIGQISARHVLVTAEPTAVTTTSGADAWLYSGPTNEDANWRSSPSGRTRLTAGGRTCWSSM